MKPRIFISAVSSELGTTRQLVANVLSRLGYDPVWQDIFGTEPGDLRQMLRNKIDDCDGLIHLVGRGCGAEPPQPDADFGRVSYTQFEFLHAQRQGKKTWVVFAEEGCTHDLPLDQLDLPRDPAHPDFAAYQAERRTLQEAWRQRLKAEGHLRHGATTDTELELKVERLKDEFRDLRRAFRSWQKNVTRNLVAVAFLLVVVGSGVWWTVFRQPAELKRVVDDSVKRWTALNPELVEVQLRKQIKATYEREHTEAEAITDWQKRGEARKWAAEARDRRFAQVEEFLKSITSKIESGQATSEYLELVRVIQEQGVDEALAYITSQESQLLSHAEKLIADKQRELRRTLAPLLEGVRLHRSKGDLSEAHALCDKLLMRDADWPDAIHQHYATMSELGYRALKYETIDIALTMFEAAATSARRLVDLDARNPVWKRDLSVSFAGLGYVFLELGRTDDALRQFEEGLKIALVEADPRDAQKQRDLSVLFMGLGELLLTLGRTDDALQQFEKCTTIFGTLSEADPRNVQKQRDLSISLVRLGDLLLTLGRTDDALRQFEKGLKITCALAEADPGDAQKQRNFSVSLCSLGNAFLMVGRKDEALRQYEASLKITHALAKADPSNTQKQFDRAFSLSELGKGCIELGRTDDALRHFKEGLKTYRELAEADPRNYEKQSNLAESLYRLGDVLWRLDRRDEALRYYEEGSNILVALMDADPLNARKQSIFGVASLTFPDRAVTDAFTKFLESNKTGSVLGEADQRHSKQQWVQIINQCELGETQVKQCDYADAIETFEKGIVELDRLIREKQLVASAEKQKTILEGRIAYCQAAMLATADWEMLLQSEPDVLPTLLSIRATECAKRGQLADVVQAGAKLRKLEPKTNDNLYNVACAFGLCAALVVNDKPEPTVAEQAEQKKFIDLSLACLKEAIAAGYDDFEHMRQDTDLTPLHGLPEFEALFPKKKE